MPLINQINNEGCLYFFAFMLTMLLSYCLCPVFRYIAIQFHILDYPLSVIKRHRTPIPYLGGMGILTSLLLCLIIINLLLEIAFIVPYEMLVGGLVIFFLGLLDDIFKKGLSYKLKLLIQLSVVLMLAIFAIPNHSGCHDWLFYPFIILWMIGIMNAINIIDMMDGFAASIAIIASVTFFLITQPSSILFKLISISLAGALLGFIPHNFSNQKKMFMGDGGSLLIGYLFVMLSLNMHYSAIQSLMVPFLILGIPIFDTLFVMIIRHQKGKSPFRGSRDHFAMRLEQWGFTKKQVVILTSCISLLLSTCAWIMMHIDLASNILLFTSILMTFIFIGYLLSHIEISE